MWRQLLRRHPGREELWGKRVLEILRRSRLSLSTSTIGNCLTAGLAATLSGQSTRSQTSHRHNHPVLLKGAVRGDGFANTLPGPGELLPSLQFAAWLHGRLVHGSFSGMYVHEVKRAIRK